MVHRMIKVNLNITVFISAVFVGVFKKNLKQYTNLQDVKTMRQVYYSWIRAS